MPHALTQTTPARASRRRRPKRPFRERGTVLLMVVGVLALLSIIAVVYASIGQADRRASVAYVRGVGLDETAASVGDYIAGVIGRDVFSTYTEQDGLNAVAPRGQLGVKLPPPPPPPSPSAPPILSLSNRPIRKTWNYPSVDTHQVSILPADPLRGEKRFKPSGDMFDPWLAPVQPTWINVNPTVPYPGYAVSSPFLMYQDWGSISNLAPDGRFVNLANLRNNFNAEPGIDSIPPTLPPGTHRMSFGLTLFGPNGLPQRSSNPGDIVTTPEGVAADVNHPADWTRNQMKAYRPIRDIQRINNPPSPASNEYLLNQWANATGDGMADSRWFELVDASRMVTSPGPGSSPNIRSLLPQSGQARFFIAAKVVDLSAMINVNTAADLVQAPDDTHPLGYTPTDIDLRKALTLQDIYQRYRFNNSPIGYDRLQGPLGGGAADYSQEKQANALAAGESGYQDLRTTLSTGLTPAVPPPVNRYTYLTPTERATQYFNFGSDPFGGSMNGTRALVSGAFGLPEEGELRTYWTANDPDRNSKLEDCVDGRNVRPTNLNKNIGPLRSNRPLEIERGGKGDYFPTAGSWQWTGHVAGDGLADSDALLQTFADLRSGLTTLSNSRPLTSVISPAARTKLAAGPGSLIAPFLEIPTDPNSRKDSGELRVNLIDRLVAPPGPNDAQHRTLRRNLAQDTSRALFYDMADAFMPYRERVRLADPSPWDMTPAMKNRGLFYGHSAELSYHMLLHMYVNLIDAIDDDKDPNANPNEDPQNVDRDIAGPTLLSAKIRPGFTGNLTDFPFTPIELPPLEMPAAATPLAGPPALNIVGIEAQPFLIEASVYTWYFDTPFDAMNRGDDEWLLYSTPNPPGPNIPSEVTIDGTIDPLNPDFLGQVIAFQLTNPFDRDIVLTPEGGRLTYYIEYAKNFYQLAGQNETGGSPTVSPAEVRLKAGETRVFYATSPQTLMDANLRFSNAGTSPTTPAGVPANFIQKFATAQFGNPNSVHIPMIDASTGMVAAAANGLLDLQGESNGATPGQKKVVHLWRVVHRGAEAPGSNVQANDTLVDRLRDPPSNTPVPPVLSTRMSTGPQRVPNSKAGPPGDPMNNTGLTVTLWGAVRRPTNPIATGTLSPSPRGIMPPWCLEAKADQAYTIGILLTNKADRAVPGVPGEPGDMSQFGGGGPNNPRYTSMDLMLTDQITNGGVSVNQQLRFAQAEQKTGNAVADMTNQSTSASGMPKSFEEKGVEVRLSGKEFVLNPAGVGYVPVLHNPGMFTRTGDILLPLAIGPENSPTLTPENGSSDPADLLDARWMTLSEAIALSMDYYTPRPSPNPNALYRNFGHSDDSATPVAKPISDRGNLVLDDYAPFYDTNGNGVYDPPVGPNPGEPSLGLGIPLALNLVDKFFVHFNDDHTGTDRRGGLSKGVAGLLNINTAPVANLAAEPLLCPDSSTSPPPNFLPLPWLTTPLNDPNGEIGFSRLPIYNPAMQTFDIATTLAAYRDKTSLQTRHLAGSGNPPPPSTINFHDTSAAQQQQDGRYLSTHIPGLHETPGFRSIGEIMAATLRTASGAPLPTTNPNFTNTIDHLGFDTAALLGYPGIDSGTFRNPIVGGTPAKQHDLVKDDYAEKIAIASAVLDTITVRSDTFVVYFILRGYLPSDVEVGTDLNTPMVPSIQRRYMMVVDRSNVLKSTDKPRILLFQEVPL